MRFSNSHVSQESILLYVEKTANIVFLRSNCCNRAARVNSIARRISHVPLKCVFVYDYVGSKVGRGIIIKPCTARVKVWSVNHNGASHEADVVSESVVIKDN